MKLRIIFLMLLFIIPAAIFPDAVETTVSVDAGKVINTFRPLNIFGNNTNGWTNPSETREKIEGAGNYLLRYPGGSWGDVFCWNSSGKYDKDNNRIPSASDYSHSAICELIYKQCNMVDDDNSTVWRSNTDTDFPGHQWVYLDFQGKKNPDKLVITWGDAADSRYGYAKKFTVQYWDPVDSRQWMVYDAEKDSWKNTSASDVKSSGGKQTVKIDAVETQYIRILMKESSAGKTGEYSVAEIKVFEGDEEITPKNNNSVVASSYNTAVKLNENNGWIFGFEQYMDFMNSFESGKSRPVIIVNLGSGTPEMAAAWVKYANKVKNYGIKYWEVGNESNAQWEAGGPLNMYDYARRYIEYYEAMKAADPSITIIAQGQADAKSGMYDGVSAIEALLSRLSKENKLKYAEGLVTHQYPTWGQHIDTVLASVKSEMKKTASQVEAALKKYPQMKDVPIWITEYNLSNATKPHDMSVRIESALWIAQYIPEFIRQFGSRGYMNMWDVMNGSNATTDPEGGDMGYLQAEKGRYQYQERAEYWAMKMLTNYWSAPGDENKHKMVEAVSGNRMLSVYANKKPDGSLALLAVNRSGGNSYKAKIDIKGYDPSKKAKVWKFDRDNYKWNISATPYHAEPNDPPSASEINNAGKSFEFEFKPYSLTVIILIPE